MPELNELEHILFSLANVDKNKLKHVARAIDFIISLDSSSTKSYDQVIANYEAIKLEAKWQQYHMTEKDFAQHKAQCFKASWIESKALQAIDSYPTSKPVVKVAPAQPEVKMVSCFNCEKAQDIDGKNSYCPESKKVFNSLESHACGSHQLKQIKTVSSKKVKVDEPDHKQLQEKATYDRYYKPKSSTWLNRNTDLVDTAAMHDSTLTRRENNDLIRNMGMTEYQKDQYGW